MSMSRASSRKTPSQKAGAIAKRKAGAAIDGVSDAERELRLIPRLINGNVVCCDGHAREVMCDPKTGAWVARYAEGEFWKLNKRLEPILRADTHLVRRCNFSYPRPIEGLFK
jgi:hypothetical protein